LSRPMSERLGKDVYIKLDALQPSGSFKLRGIGYACQKAVRDGARSFTSSSGGNAGLATAYAGLKLNIPTTVVVPTTTPEFIRERLRAFDATVIVHGSQWSEANEEAMRVNARADGKLVHPFDDPDAWTGHATLVHEVARDLGGAVPKIGAFVTCVGGGGLLAGILQGLREIGPSGSETITIAAETVGADSMTTSLEAGEAVTLPGIRSIAKSLGAASPSPTVFEEAFRLFTHERKRVWPIRVTDRDAVLACLLFADDHRVLVEPACGAALAAIYVHRGEARAAMLAADGPVVVEVCGGAIVDRGILEQYAKQFDICV